MRLKQRPEDFVVTESFRYDEVPHGRYRVYLMDKQKLSTFDAVIRIQSRFGLKPGSVSYCGLKDKQGRTEQLVAVEGHDVDMQDADLRLKFMGRTDKPLSAENTTSNRFAVTVRAVTKEEHANLQINVAEVERLGVVNYFDSQRFGALKHGQGFIAKDLLRGDFESALKNYMAVPSPLDHSQDAKVKVFWKENWGDWNARCPYDANKKYFRILYALREEPTNFVRAFLQIDSAHRAMMLFTLQSFLWNEGARRLLQLVLPRESIVPLPYQGGTLLFHIDAPRDVLEFLRRHTFPLLAPDTKFTDPRIEEAATWALGKSKLTLDQLQVKEARKMLFFKHEERPILVYPKKLVVGDAAPDELNKPQLKLNIAFTLPPGSYATLVVKRLFRQSFREDSAEEIRASQTRAWGEAEHPVEFTPAAREGQPAVSARAEPHAKKPRSERSPRHRKRPPPERPGERTGARTFDAMKFNPSADDAPAPAPNRPQGFRELSRQKKAERAQNRAKAAKSGHKKR